MKIRQLFQQLFTATIIVISGFSCINYFLTTFTYGRVDFDHVADWENRFADLHSTLPLQRGTVGYISDWDIPDAIFDISDQDAEFILTQYALSPFILVRGEEQEWIVGSLSPSAYKKWVKIRKGEYEDIKFKGNVYLFHRIK
jgi:hypothetical protein